MRPGFATVRALPASPLDVAGREIPFPERSSVHRLRTLRQELFQKGRLTEALEVARRLMDLTPGRESAWRLGVIQRELGLYQESLRTFRDALRYVDGPAYVLPEIHLHAAYSWYKLHDYRRMGECLRRVSSLRPKTRSDHMLHMSFGSFFMARKDYRQAYDEFQKAEKAAKNSILRGRALVNMGVAAYHQGDLAQASTLLEKAVAIHKRAGHAAELANARYLCGVIYFDLRLPGRAKSIITRAARHFQRCGQKEKEAVAWGDAGNACLLLEDWPQAKSYLDRAASLANECQSRRLMIVVHALRAQANARLGSFLESVNDLALARKTLRGYRDYPSTCHVIRAQARIAELFGEWGEMRYWTRRGERYAMRESDRARVAEFRAARARAEHELGRIRAAFHARKTAKWITDLIGRGSKLMEAARHDALRLAKTELPLLIAGESGTGKTELAIELHKASSRAQGPCAVVPCETLVFVASELNGHAESAWSGARGRAEGLVQRAAGGTLILDRVDELDAEAQRILIPIVDGRVRAVGSELVQRLDSRIIAVCRKPDRLIPDLRRRLEGARIEVPPLRERAEDIPVMVRSMLGSRVRITEDALALMARQPWAGNVTELNGFVERLVTTSGATLGVQAVKAALPKPPGRQARRAHELVAMATAFVG